MARLLSGAEDSMEERKCIQKGINSKLKHASVEEGLEKEPLRAPVGLSPELQEKVRLAVDKRSAFTPTK